MGTRQAGSRRTEEDMERMLNTAWLIKLIVAPELRRRASMETRLPGRSSATADLIALARATPLLPPVGVAPRTCDGFVAYLAGVGDSEGALWLSRYGSDGLARHLRVLTVSADSPGSGPCTVRDCIAELWRRAQRSRRTSGFDGAIFYDLCSRSGCGGYAAACGAERTWRAVSGALAADHPNYGIMLSLCAEQVLREGTEGQLLALCRGVN